MWLLSICFYIQLHTTTRQLVPTPQGLADSKSDSLVVLGGIHMLAATPGQQVPVGELSRQKESMPDRRANGFFIWSPVLSERSSTVGI